MDEQFVTKSHICLGEVLVLPSDFDPCEAICQNEMLPLLPASRHSSSAFSSKALSCNSSSTSVQPEVIKRLRNLPG